MTTKKKAPRRRKKAPKVKVYKVRKAISDRFDQIAVERQAAIQQIETRVQGQLSEWAIMARKEANVPGDLAVAYDPKRKAFVDRAAPEQQEQGK